MLASSCSFAPVPPPDLWQPHERRIASALLCSGGFHALLAVAVIAVLALHPPRPEPVRDRPPLEAVLRDWQPSPATFEVATLPDLASPPVPLLAPAPKVPMPTIASRPAPAVPRPLPASSSPDGIVGTAQLLDPSVLGYTVAARIAERYPRRADKEPSVQIPPSLSYPVEARQAHESARISAVLDIDATGRITSVMLVPEHRWFGPAVREALKQVQMAPARIGGAPAPYWAIVEFVFVIAPAPKS